MTQQRAGCPRDLFTTDLVEAISQWIEEGDRIILGIDANEDLRWSDLSKRLAALGLREVILSTHGTNGPAMYQWGQRPIDGLFVSLTMPLGPCGYLAFGAGMPSDHRPLWFDFPLQWMVGAEPIS